MITVDSETFTFIEMVLATDPDQVTLDMKYDCKNAIEEDDSGVSKKHKTYQKKKRENSWVRKDHYKRTFMHKFYQGVNLDNFECASRTVRNYLVYDLDKPSKFFRIEGQYNSCFFSGPNYKQEKKHRTSRRLRHCQEEQIVHASRSWYKRLGFEEPDYANKF